MSRTFRKLEGWNNDSTYTKYGRDKKPYYKPPKWFKRMRRQIERTKIRDSMKSEEYDNLPRFKNSDQWDWN